MVQYSNMANTCQQAEKRWYSTQTEPKHVTSQKKMVQFSNCAKTCLQSEKYGSILSAESEKGDTILKQSQKLSQVRKRWYNTQTEPKPVSSQKKMVQY